MRSTSKMTAYETLCYLASQERTDEIAAYAKAQVAADERAEQIMLWVSIGAAALVAAGFFLSAI